MQETVKHEIPTVLPPLKEEVKSDAEEDEGWETTGASRKQAKEVKAPEVKALVKKAPAPSAIPQQTRPQPAPQ